MTAASGAERTHSIELVLWEIGTAGQNLCYLCMCVSSWRLTQVLLPTRLCSLEAHASTFSDSFQFGLFFSGDGGLVWSCSRLGSVSRCSRVAFSVVTFVF